MKLIAVVRDSSGGKEARGAWFFNRNIIGIGCSIVLVMFGFSVNVNLVFPCELMHVSM